MALLHFRNERRNFVIACGDHKKTEQIMACVRTNIANASFIVAVDGADAFFKITNDPPHAVIVDRELTKMTPTSLVESVLAQRNLHRVGIILLDDIPEQDFFVNEVVMGRVQFINDLDNSDKVSMALSRIMNYACFGDNREFRVKFLAPEEQLIKLGEKGESVYIVKSGQLRATIDQNGAPILLGQIEPGEFVGEMAYINGEPRSADVFANTNCELIEIPMDCLDHVLFQKPAWSKALMKTLSKRVKTANRSKIS